MIKNNNLIAGIHFGEHTYNIAYKICEDNMHQYPQSGKKDGFSTNYRRVLFEGFIKIACDTPINKESKDFMNEVCKNIGLLMSKNKIPYTIKNECINTLFEKNYEALKLVVSYNSYVLGNLKKDYLTEELLEIGIKKNPYAIRFVNNPSDKLIEKAIKKNAFAIKFINNPSDKLIEKAIKKNAFAIKFIRNQTRELRDLAYSIDPRSKKFFTDKCNY